MNEMVVLQLPEAERIVYQEKLSQASAAGEQLEGDEFNFSKGCSRDTGDSCTMSSGQTSQSTVPPLHSPKSPVWPIFPFNREGSRICERGSHLLRDLPSPLPTKRTRTYSATARASAGPVYKGVCKQFSRSQGHGFITPETGTEDIFVHVSDIEGEYVPVEGDEVTYKICPIPPKNQKFQAVEVVLTHLAPHTKHETWSGQIIGS
ncbi:hypothetical protein lerEdw1_019636 [Lerista edwardsae]|nr:hypothetical protein lerEdw1_019636 [Lerista edwardsae]